MSDISQQIAKIEKEIRETPYHKATEHHIGKLRARVARLKDKELEGVIKSKGGGGGGYAIKKQGDATIVLVGPPSVGKSTLINKLTNAESKVAPYAFTTVSVIPGMLKYKDAYIQILDIPGLIEGAKMGKGRGREVLSVARGADLLIIMADVQKPQVITSLVSELEGAGIRINQKPPDVRIEKKVKGGLIIHSNIKQNLRKETIIDVAQEYGLKNAEVTIKENLTFEKLIDAFSPSRAYIPAIFILNKIDLHTGRINDLEPKVVTHHQYKPILISAEKGTGMNGLKEEIWDKLGLVRVYLVRADEEPSFDNPIIMKSGNTLKDVAEKIGTEFAEGKKLAKIWGVEAKFPGQEVPLTKEIEENLQVRFI